MAVKKDFSAARASAAKVITAAGYTAAAIELTSRAAAVAAARLNAYLESDMDSAGKKLICQLDAELKGTKF